MDLSQIEEGTLAQEYLIKQVWKDRSFGISLRKYIEQGLVLNR